MEKIIIEDLLNKDCHVDNEYEHITYDGYQKMTMDDKKSVPLKVLKQIQIKHNVKNIIKYFYRFKHSKHISIALLILTLICLIKLPVLFTIISGALFILSVLFCWKQYTLLDAHSFAYLTMQKFFEKAEL